MSLRVRIANMIAPQYELRSIDPAIVVADALQAAYATSLAHVGALEAAAGMISRSLMICKVAGPARLRFDVATMRDIGRDLVVKGEYVGLLDLPLVHVYEFALLPNRDIRYTVIENGQSVKVTTGDYLHVKWSDAADGRGHSALENARQLWSIASHAERVQRLELGGVVGSVIPMPNTMKAIAEDIEATQSPADIKAAIKGKLQRLTGETVLLPTTQQGARRQGDVPMNEYEQKKLQPNVKETTLRAHDSATIAILRATGIPPLLMSQSVPPTRESMKQFHCLTIDPLARLIESEAARKGMTIEIDTTPLKQADFAMQARAFGIYIQSGLSIEEAADIVGVDIDEQA